MTKINLNNQSLILSETPAASFASRSEPARRLLVLVSCLEVDLVFMARRIWQLANASNARVLLLGLYNDPAQEPRLRRELITISAMANNGGDSVEIEVVFGNDWIEAVKTRYLPDDMIVCLAEERVGLLRKPLSKILQAQLTDAPLYILSGLYREKYRQLNRFFSQSVVWAGTVSLIFGFSLLQIRIDRLAQSWTQTALLFFSILFECWVIWVWNSFFS